MNIAEILKNYPTGTKLYSPICGECQFISINSGMYPIHVSNVDKSFFYFTENGKYRIEGECLLFPSKDNRDWNTMTKLKFKKGDFVYRKLASGNIWVSIHYDINPNNKVGDVESIVDMYLNDYLTHKSDLYIFSINKTKKPLCFIREIKEERFATEEEKQLLLKTLDNEGYMWDEEKLEIREKQEEYCFTPFEKVLVRDFDNENWKIGLFSNMVIDSSYSYVCMDSIWKQCIPYKGNEYLLGIAKKPE